MFEAAQALTGSEIAMGVIWAVVLGFAAGNYACSLVHRLPRGKLLLDKPPYCGSCGELLQTKDLFPVFSALWLRHKCRYCGDSYPTSHTWTELLVGALFVLAFLQFNFSEQFLLIILVGTFLITLAAIEGNESMISWRVLLCVAIFGALFRVLEDGTLYSMFGSALIAGILGIVITYKQTKKLGHIYVPSPLAILLAVGGLCVGQQSLWLFLALFAVLGLASKLSKHIPITVPYGVAVTALILYPEYLAGLVF